MHLLQCHQSSQRDCDEAKADCRQVFHVTRHVGIPYHHTDQEESEGDKEYRDPLELGHFFLDEIEAAAFQASWADANEFLASKKPVGRVFDEVQLRVAKPRLQEVSGGEDDHLADLVGSEVVVGISLDDGGSDGEGAGVVGLIVVGRLGLSVVGFTPVAGSASMSEMQVMPRVARSSAPSRTSRLATRPSKVVDFPSSFAETLASEVKAAWTLVSVRLLRVVRTRSSCKVTP